MAAHVDVNPKMVTISGYLTVMHNYAIIHDFSQQY
jgi:hypothetical protein